MKALDDLREMAKDFQEKADYYHGEAKRLYNEKRQSEATICDSKSHGFEYCAAALRIQANRIETMLKLSNIEV